MKRVRRWFAQAFRTDGALATKPDVRETAPPTTSRSSIRLMARQSSSQFIHLEDRTNSDRRRLLQLRAPFANYFGLRARAAARIDRQHDQADCPGVLISFLKCSYFALM